MKVSAREIIGHQGKHEGVCQGDDWSSALSTSQAGPMGKQLLFVLINLYYSITISISGHCEGPVGCAALGSGHCEGPVGGLHWAEG